MDFLAKTSSFGPKPPLAVATIASVEKAQCPVEPKSVALEISSPETFTANVEAEEEVEQNSTSLLPSEMDEPDSPWMLKTLPDGRRRFIFKNEALSNLKGSKWQLYVKDFRYWAKTNAIYRFSNRVSFFRRSIVAIEGSFGTAISSFFSFHHYVVNLNMLIFLLSWFPLVIIPWFAHPNAEFSVTSSSELSGLLGSPSVFDHSFFFYGGFLPSSKRPDNYDMAFAYTCCILLTFLISLAVFTHTFSGMLRSSSVRQAVVHSDSRFPISSVVFASMDFRIREFKSIRRLQGNVVQSLREMMSEKAVEEFKQQLSVSDKRKLIARRVFGILFTLFVLTLAFVILGYVADEQVALTSAWSYSVPVLVSVVNVGLPIAVNMIVEFEKWTDLAEKNRQVVARTFVLKMFSLVYLLFTISEVGNSKVKGCTETIVGRLFHQMIVMDFLITSSSTIVTALVTRYIFKQKVELKVASLVIETIYRQALIWIGSTCAPMIPLLGWISNTVIFFIRKIIMLKIGKPLDKPSSAGQSKTFFLSFLFATMFISAVPVSWFLQRDSESACGPHRTSSSPLNALSDAVYKGPQGLDIILRWVFSPLVLVAIIIALVIGLRFATNINRRNAKLLTKALADLEFEKKQKQTESIIHKDSATKDAFASNLRQRHSPSQPQ